MFNEYICCILSHVYKYLVTYNIIVIVEHLCWRYAIYVNLRKYILVI